MSAPMRRCACPSLSKPMQTGDGLLVRLRPLEGGLSPEQLDRVAEAAGRFGNGILEVTRRGNLQVRGLTPESATRFADSVEAIGIAVTSGVPIETGPLAGFDAREIADPRPLARIICEAVDRAGLASRLGPKVSVVVDGGGALPMDDVAADVRLAARRGGGWRVAVGGAAKEATPLGVLAETDAASAVLSVLEAIAVKGSDARGRDLETAGEPEGGGVEHTSSPIGLFNLAGGDFALGVGLPFGQTDARALRSFADVAAGYGAPEIRFAPGRGLLAIGVTGGQCESLRNSVRLLDFVTEPSDPRLFIAACAGSPACRSAFIAARTVAADIARTASELLDGSFILHLSGCVKGCARPHEPVLSLVGTAPGSGDVLLDSRHDASIAQAREGDMAAIVAELALLFQERRQHTESARAFLNQQSANAGLAGALSVERA